MSSEDLRIKQLEQKLENKNKEIEYLQGENKRLQETVSNLDTEAYKFKELVYSSRFLFAIFLGEDFIIDVANDSLKKVWGKGDDIIGKPLLELLPELKDQGIKELLENVYRTGEPYYADEVPIELIINGKPEIRYFDFTYQPQRNAQGEIIGVADIAADVTKQALLNKKIKKSEREFRKLVNFMPHKISLANAEGETIFYNQNWLDYVDKNLEDFIDEPWTDILHPDEKEKVEDVVAGCLSKGNNFDKEIRLRDRNGDYKWHICRATAVKNEEGEITSWISSSTEIQKLKDEEKRNEDFLKLISHELKTPVTSIKGYVQLLLSMLPKNNSDIDKKLIIKPYLNRIETQVERLIRLISEMLDMSRIEQNELELKKEEFNLNQHTEEIIEDLTYTNKDFQLELQHDFECDVFADKDRIGQVLINFITNAVKYSPDSNRVQIKIHEYDPETVAITVKDFGIGIKENEQKQIFKRFYRISGEKADTYAGFGIGLFLSNEIIERHNGKIIVKSEVGKGSEFTFTIPLNHKL